MHACMEVKLQSKRVEKKDIEINSQSIIPRNPLESWVSCIDILSLIPLRIAGLEFISSTAASIATFAISPTVELKDKIAPILTILGLLETPSFVPLEEKPL